MVDVKRNNGGKTAAIEHQEIARKKITPVSGQRFGTLVPLLPKPA
jgi:hypothetical protein